MSADTASIAATASPAEISLDVGDVRAAAARFKALGHPHRLQLALRLAEYCGDGSCSAEHGQCVGDLAADLEIKAPAVSHHLKELRTAGLIDMERDGQFVRCSLRPGTLELLRSPAVRSWLGEA